jgi:hypothetical protein
MGIGWKISTSAAGTIGAGIGEAIGAGCGVDMFGNAFKFVIKPLNDALLAGSL